MKKPTLYAFICTALLIPVSTHSAEKAGMKESGDDMLSTPKCKDILLEKKLMTLYSPELAVPSRVAQMKAEMVAKMAAERDAKMEAKMDAKIEIRDLKIDKLNALQPEHRMHQDEALP